MSVGAVLLDAGGVLLLPNVDDILRELGAEGITVDSARLPRAHYAGMRAVDVADGAPPYWHHYTRAYVDVLGVSPQDVIAARSAVVRAFTDMEWNAPIQSSIDALAALASCASHVAVVSNSDGTVEAVLRSHGIGDELAAVIDSHVVGTEKPDPAIFALALDALGVRPQEAIHVGDSVRFDVVGARNAGVRPVHLDPYGYCQDDDHEHITSLEEVTRLI